MEHNHPEPHVVQEPSPTSTSYCQKIRTFLTEHHVQDGEPLSANISVAGSGFPIRPRSVHGTTNDIIALIENNLVELEGAFESDFLIGTEHSKTLTVVFQRTDGTPLPSLVFPLEVPR